MKNLRLLTFYSLVLYFIFPVFVFAQQDATAPVQSRWEVLNNNVELNYYNSDYCDYYLISSRMKELQLSPGKNNLLSVPRESAVKYKNDPTFMQSSFITYKGYFPEKLNPDFLYALPVKSGRSTICKVDNTKRALNYLFIAGVFDTVYAVREGVVCKNRNEGLRNSQESIENNNSLLLYHTDRTFALYTKLTKLFVREGSEVSVGQPIGLASKKGIISISFFYLDKNKLDGGNKSGLPHTHFKPLFHTSEGNFKLEENKPYISDFNDEIITQEMSKREKKRYEKKKLKLAQK